MNGSFSVPENEAFNNVPSQKRANAILQVVYGKEEQHTILFRGKTVAKFKSSMAGM